MTVSSTRGIGDYYTAEGHLAILPKFYKRDGTVPGIIYLHGATQNETQMIDNTNAAGLVALLATIGSAGWPILGVYAGGDQWGNATGQARIDDAKTYLQGALGAKAGGVALIGASMGGLSILNWAKNHLSSVLCAVGLVPVSDVSDMVTNNRQSLAGSINTAYGTWNEGTMGASYNPHTYAASGLAGLRYKAWYGASDTTVIPATVTDVVASIGATATGVSVAGDHNSTIGLIPTADVITFLKAYAS